MHSTGVCVLMNLPMGTIVVIFVDVKEEMAISLGFQLCLPNVLGLNVDGPELRNI